MRVFRNLRIVALIVITFLLLTGCSKAPKPTPPENPAAIYILNGKTDQLFKITDSELVADTLRQLYNNPYKNGQYLDKTKQMGSIYLVGFFDKDGKQLSETFAFYPQNYLLVGDYLYQMPTLDLIHCIAKLEEHETGVDPIETGGIVDPNAPIMQPWP